MEKFKSIFEEEMDYSYKEDCHRIKRCLAEHDYDISLKEAYQLWGTYSEEYYAAGWLIMPSDDEDLWNILERLKTN